MIGDLIYIAFAGVVVIVVVVTLTRRKLDEVICSLDDIRRSLAHIERAVAAEEWLEPVDRREMERARRSRGVRPGR
jgi:hypothetical protein